MQIIKLHSHTDQAGILKLEVPLGLSEVDVEVIVVVQPTRNEHGWPPGFFERTIGAWVGDLERAPQGEYEVRESFD